MKYKCGPIYTNRLSPHMAGVEVVSEISDTSTGLIRSFTVVDEGNVLK